MNIALWVVQGLLALLFLLAGIMKAFLPLATVKKNLPWANDVPAALVRFIGISELLGAIGLVAPALAGILPWLIVAAAAGLVIAMLCATVFHIARREFTAVGMPIVLLLLAAFIVLGRWALSPL
jgi:putative oxidoreductase